MTFKNYARISTFLNSIDLRAFQFNVRKLGEICEKSRDS